MSEQRLAELYERLRESEHGRVGSDYPFPRGWNAAIEFAIAQVRRVFDDPEPPEQPPDPQ